jgi:4-diphosphocytidyl-2-C-methyl-D-erythritol kinase
MGRAISLLAPAKVNLHLEVGGKRPDGYHEIVSLVQAVSLYDGISIRSLKQQGGFRLHCGAGIPVQQNIVGKAVQLFRRETGLGTGVSIRVRKRIPVGAGLGGGSSDAAAVLKGLSVLLGASLSMQRLWALAAALGSDVPFFLNGPAALMTGRGEQIRPLSPRTDFWLVLLYPGFPVWTQQAYAWLDAEAPAEPDGEALASGRLLGGEPGGPAAEGPGVASLQSVYSRRPVASWRFRNSFQAVVERRMPLLREAREYLAGSGAALAGLSGSGSTVYGLFTEEGPARRAKRRVPFSCAMTEVVEPLRNACSGG